MPLARCRARVTGVVQGVGFRPYVYRLAYEEDLGGWVLNDSSGVLLEVEGPAEAVERFLARLALEAPPLAEIERVDVEAAAPLGDAQFTIVASAAGRSPNAAVVADSATCADCQAELFDPSDRRHRYPFINCTNCGPRFTIVQGVPYDRPRTTMAGFEMCAACRAEYEDPLDRRFHAQPNACPECGPQVSMPLEEAAGRLLAGEILAVKGIGGFHLACRADDENAVARLRARKHREAKPFALLVSDPRGLVELGPKEEALLRSRARPIVVARRSPGARVAESVAPDNPDLGVMLPYSPLHHLLAQDTGVPLVLTSGNVSDEPIAFRDEDALERLGAIADAFLLHDRPIQTRTDDSVVRATASGMLILRRSRGYVPGALPLPVFARRPLLACGAELKNTFCVAKESRAWVSHHIGDLENYETLTSFSDGIAHFQALFAVTPEVVAHDLHPDYLSTRYALEREGVELVAVQHHHAHLAAVLAEHGLQKPAVGAIFDGTGLGSDGTIWGGEILVGDLHGFERATHLHPARLPGGEQAIRQPWRMAAAWLLEAGEPVPDAWRPAERLLSSGLNSPVTTSVGRLFDAVAALCGIRTEITYEGQAAIELEAACDPAARGAYELDALDARPLIRAIAADVRAGVDVGTIATRFHRALATATARTVAATAREHDLDTAVLAGGVFANRVLLDATTAQLEAEGLRVLLPRRLPPGDGAISYGQAAIAAATRAPP